MFGEPGLVQVYTGTGKGKTTAALGIALRACGQGARVAMIQFMKGWPHYGEIESAKHIPNFTLIQTGRPDYVCKGKATPADYAEAERGLALAEELLHTNACDMLILDEINVALDFELIALEKVVSLIRAKPPEVELILTGRGAKEEILALAGLISEMSEIRHPYQQGQTARKGVEY